MPPVAPAPPRRGGRFFWAVLFALLLGGCRVDATVETLVEGRSGEVVARFALDREAVELLGGPVDGGIQAADLRRAGWVVSRPRGTRSGGASVQVSKRFHRPEDLGRVMAELSGPGGPLRGFRLERRRGLTKIRYRLEGNADLREGEAATGLGNVPDLTSRLRGAGVDPQRVDELLISRAAAGFHLRVVAALPGRRPAWDVPPGKRVEIRASSSAPDRTRTVLLALAAVSALGALVMATGGRRRIRREPSPT
jgi:hypothetical protein